MADIVNRIGGKLIRIDAEWGTAIDPQALKDAIEGRKPKLVAVVHAETSTGVYQPLEDLARISHDAGALFLVDTVTSLGGMPVAIDDMNIDAVYSGTQKCISGPPGLSPVSFSQAAVKAMDQRKTPVVSWYLDLSMVRDYWGTERKYHHTAPINMIYSLREALRLITEEGLDVRFERHRLNHRALVAGIEAMGLSMLVPEPIRLPMLNAVRIPEGVEDITVRKVLLNQYGIEIGGGLGQFAGKVWRIGLMGHSCRRKNVHLLLAALETVLKSEGYPARPGALDAAAAVYDQAC
jgi:alanine-glyoxylate transaminase/serine-glyoxylate transaminase/serine-pyruvate transaminase